MSGAAITDATPMANIERASDLTNRESTTITTAAASPAAAPAGPNAQVSDPSDGVPHSGLAFAQARTKSVHAPKPSHSVVTRTRAAPDASATAIGTPLRRAKTISDAGNIFSPPPATAIHGAARGQSHATPYPAAIRGVTWPA